MDDVFFEGVKAELVLAKRRGRKSFILKLMLLEN